MQSIYSFHQDYAYDYIFNALLCVLVQCQYVYFYNISNTLNIILPKQYSEYTFFSATYVGKVLYRIVVSF